MNIVMISGSRADKGGILGVKLALEELGFKPRLEPPDLIWRYDIPDLAVVLGDRLEILKAVVDIYLHSIPIAHLSGGDITEGSQDDCMRHAITKLSHLHFVTNEESRRRVVQMGEDPNRVYNVGYPGVDLLEVQGLQEAKAIARILSYDDFLLVVWHPDTLADEDENLGQVQTLTRALDKVFMKTLVIGPNADRGNYIVSNHLKRWCNDTKNVYVDELPRKTYLTLLKYCKCLVGNSSSAYYEAPSFGAWAVDIGDRQAGRMKPRNVLNCTFNVQKIAKAIWDFTRRERLVILNNPYGDGLAAQRIASIIAQIKDPKKLLRKKWHDMGTQAQGNGIRSDLNTLRGSTQELQKQHEDAVIPSIWDWG